MSAPLLSRLAAPNSGTGTAAVPRLGRVAKVNQTRHRAVSILLPSCMAKAVRDGATVLRAQSVGLLVQKEHDVPKEELLQFEGLVTEILPDARYRVQLDNGHQLVAYTAGRMKKNRIKTLAGDRVTVEVSPYDLEKGRLIFRHKDERAGSLSRPPQRQQFRRR